MGEKIEFVTRNILIRKDQLKWILDNHINFSRWVRAKIDEEMRGGKKDGKE